MTASSHQLPSPFHKGEQEAQTRAGSRDRTELIGQRAIRSFMPDQHRTFFEKIPFVVLGSVDQDGWPWASIISGGSGFMTSPSATSLVINAKPVQHDPVGMSLAIGAPVGLLGIELGTRRRNRMNAKVAATTSDGIKLDVVQSFGNCPKYIQTHNVTFQHDPTSLAQLRSKRFHSLDEAEYALIEQSDTFFVASSAVSDGVDVSHRGGRAGFVKVDGNRLTIPDYAGNNFFNTIGNFLKTPTAGLLFPNFETGDLLMLTGSVEMLWEDHPEVKSIKGALRAWRFTLDHGIHIYDALPFRAEFKEYSPYSLNP